ncbi:OsmC family protein [Lonepinella koalarum]|uniref:OsmC family protein n=1 Tax=Lonepinella koalarum TaxID=53417 RepID=UPI003F6E3955
MTEDKLTLTLPSGFITKIQVGEFTLLTDYPKDRGGSGIALNPWRLFLAAMLSCHGVNLAKYCYQQGLDYSQIEVNLIPLVEDCKTDEFPEYQIHVRLPPDFPSEHIQPMVDFFTDCPVANHLVKLKTILKTFVNGKLICTHAR